MKKFSVEIKWAMIYTLAAVVWAIGEKETGLYSSHIDVFPLATLLFGPIGLLFYIVSIREKRRSWYAGNITWRQAFYSGLALTAAIVFLTPLQKVIVHHIVAPDFFRNAIAYSMKSGRTHLEAQKYFNLKSSIYDSISLTLSAGVTASAALALVMRTKKS